MNFECHHETYSYRRDAISTPFCPTCARPLDLRFVEVEGRDRLICEEGHIHYENPKVVVGTLPVCDGKIWLLRRAIDPRAGYWTYPTGFMELGESVEGAALRETVEEIAIDVKLVGPARVYSRPEATAVFIIFLADASDQARAMEEALEVRLVAPTEIPWDDLAFWSTHAALRDWVNSLK